MRIRAKAAVGESELTLAAGGSRFLALTWDDEASQLLIGFGRRSDDLCVDVTLSGAEARDLYARLRAEYPPARPRRRGVRR